MSLSYLLVDGHNVMHAWPELRRLQSHVGNRHLARLELLHRLRQLQDLKGTRVVVVFDGTQAQSSEEREKDGLQIFYANAASTADSIIERLTAKYVHQFPLRVASADGMVRETILALGADWISPETLQALCETAEADMRAKIKNSGS